MLFLTTEVMINLSRTMTGHEGVKHKVPKFTIKSSNRKKKCYALKKPILFLSQIKFIIRLTITGSSLFHTKE